MSTSAAGAQAPQGPTTQTPAASNQPTGAAGAPAAPAGTPTPAALATPTAPPAQPGLSAEQVQAYYQAWHQETSLRVALARAGVHDDTYSNFLVNQYAELAKAGTAPPAAQWIESARAQHSAFFSGALAAAASVAAQPQVAGAPAQPAPLPVPSAGAPVSPAGLPGAVAAPALPAHPQTQAVPTQGPPGWTWNGAQWVQVTAPAQPAAPQQPQPFGLPQNPAGLPQFTHVFPVAAPPQLGTTTPPAHDAQLSLETIERMSPQEFARRAKEIEQWDRQRRAAAAR